MKDNGAIFAGVLFGLVAGNYFYQLAGSMNWAVATERSFFQAVAIHAVYGLLWLKEYRDSALRSRDEGK